MFNFWFNFTESLLGFQRGCFVVLHINRKPMSFSTTFFFSPSKFLILRFSFFKTFESNSCKSFTLITFVVDTPYGHWELLTCPYLTYFPFDIKMLPSNLHETSPLLSFNNSSLIEVFCIFFIDSFQAFSLVVQVVTLARLRSSLSFLQCNLSPPMTWTHCLSHVVSCKFNHIN